MPERLLESISGRIGKVDPFLTRLRTKLAACRTQGMGFEEAWEYTLSSTKIPPGWHYSGGSDEYETQLQFAKRAFKKYY